MLGAGPLPSHSGFPGPQLADLHGATLLIGSGLSGERTNGLPAGGALSEAIFSRLLSYSGMDAKLFWNWGWITPFEQILNDHPDPVRLEAIFRACYGAAHVNRFQARLAELVRDGHVEAIITTNYDCCLEGALRGAGVAFSQIVGPSDLLQPRSVPLFKIHGSVDRPDEPLVLSLRQEGVLQPWKDNTFRNLCRGKQLYILGYSGRDFDICPVLFSTDYVAIYWLDRPPSGGKLDPHAMSAHLRFALEHSDQVPRLALVHGTFGDVLDVHETFIPAVNVGDVVDKIFEGEGVDADPYKLWAVSLFQAISCRSVAERILENLRPRTFVDDVRKLQFRSDLEERRGAYRTSAETLRRVAAALEAVGDCNEAAKSMTLRAWRLFTSASLVPFFVAHARAVRYVDRAKLARDGRFDVPLADARIAYVRILRWALMLFLPWPRELFKIPLVRKRVLALAFPALETFQSRGLWQEHYLLSKQLQDFGLTGDVKESRKHLPAAFGFGQLGNLVGDTSVYRRGPKRDPARAKFLLDGLRCYGLYPEYWKFYYEFRDVLGRMPGHGHTAREALRAYWRCEISMLGHFLNTRRVFRLLIGAIRSR